MIPIFLISGALVVLAIVVVMLCLKRRRQRLANVESLGPQAVPPVQAVEMMSVTEPPKYAESTQTPMPESPPLVYTQSAPVQYAEYPPPPPAAAVSAPVQYPESPPPVYTPSAPVQYADTHDFN